MSSNKLNSDIPHAALIYTY